MLLLESLHAPLKLLIVPMLNASANMRDLVANLRMDTTVTLPRSGDILASMVDRIYVVPREQMPHYTSLSLDKQTDL